MNALIFIFMAVFLFGCLAWHVSRSRSVLQDWARDHAFEIIDREERIFMKGPFFWTSSRGQVVFYVTVRDSEGHFRKGWVRCGSFFSGLFSDRAEVRWDDYATHDRHARDWMGRSVNHPST